MQLTEWDLFQEVVPLGEVRDRPRGFHGKGIVSSGLQVVMTFAVVAGSAWIIPTRPVPIATRSVIEVTRPAPFSASVERQPRGPRDLHAPDAAHGRSSRKLAQAFDGYFVPAEPDEPYDGDDYSFF